MDFNRLCALATNAIGTVLRYHTDIDLLPNEGLPIFIGQAIRDLYPLRDMEHVQDTSVADLEIACDAALSVAEAYNQAPRNQHKINLRWFYICVQGLLLVDIKPQLLLDGVDRLPRNARPQEPQHFQQPQQPQQPQPLQPWQPQQSQQPQQPQQRPFQSDTGDRHFSPAGSSPTLAPDSYLPSPSFPERSAPSSSDSSSGGDGSTKRVCMAKASWEDDEIKLMVDLKASGMRHSDIAMRLGRGLGSVENKYGRVMHQDKWKDYLAQVEARSQKKRKHSS